MLVKVKFGTEVYVKIQLIVFFAGLIQIASSGTSAIRNSLNTIEHADSTSKITDDIPLQFPDSGPSKNSTRKRIKIVYSNELLIKPNLATFENISRAINDDEPSIDKIVMSNNTLPTSERNTSTNSTISENISQMMNDNYEPSTDKTVIYENTAPVTNTEENNARNLIIMKTEISKRTAIILLTVVANASIIFYFLLVSLRKILARKYGDRELLMQNQKKNREYCC